MKKKTIKTWFIRINIAVVNLLMMGWMLSVAADRLWPFPEQKLKIYAPSPMVYDAKSRNMLGLVSPQQQWVMPVKLDNINPFLIDATIAVEDSRFYHHSGVDVYAVIRAIGQNISQYQIVSGASTLTMQLCRMMENRPRTLKSKAIESFRARQLEKIRTKDEILELYLNHAPYGGNIRGVEAASLFYFSKHAGDLSIAQSAFLAGLPQSPTRYNPFTHHDRALQRQQYVLDRMLAAGKINEDQYHQASQETMSIMPADRLIHAPHAAWMALSRRPDGGQTTINLDIQSQIESIIQPYRDTLPSGSEIAAVVIDIQKSAIVALTGSADSADPVDGQVNGAMAKRSPGSTLKPFVYALAFEAGRLSPESILYDVPISLGGWTPSNFDRTYEGAVSAGNALRKSLNIPALWIASCMGSAYCYNHLESLGIRLPHNVEIKSGLSFVVGGCEASLLDTTNAYAVFGREGFYRECRLFENETSSPKQIFSPEVCDNINHILSCKIRVPHGLEYVDSEMIPWFMWKTGTSSGRRDAWAVGHNGRFAVGVWVGRFRGTGRYEYVGSVAAEPLLAQIFLLPELRNPIEPGPPAPILVLDPMPVPDRIDEKLHILFPENGDVFIAYHGKMQIYPKANQTAPLHWFLNGVLLENTKWPVEVPAGQYQLRCVNQQGNSSESTFYVQIH